MNLVVLGGFFLTVFCQTLIQKGDCASGASLNALKRISTKRGSFLKRLMKFQPDVNILYPSYPRRQKDHHLGLSSKLKPRRINKKKRNNAESLRFPCIRNAE